MDLFLFWDTFFKSIKLFCLTRIVQFPLFKSQFVQISFIYHPDSSSLEVVDKYFTQYALEEQDILGQKKCVDKVLALVPEDILFLF